jgi:hypothetical protein
MAASTRSRAGSAKNSTRCACWSRYQRNAGTSPKSSKRGGRAEVFGAQHHDYQTGPALQVFDLFGALGVGIWGGIRILEEVDIEVWRLRYAVYLFSEQTITRCVWAETYYKAHRAKDHSHARSLRCLGQRWLKIIHKMWLERTPYDPELHHRNQVKHSSWVFQFKNT